MTYARDMQQLITPTHQELDARWERAQGLESARNREAARAEYLSILALDAYHVPALLRLSRHAQQDDDFGLSRKYAMQAADAVRFAARYRQISYVSLRLLDFAEDAEVASVILSADWSNPHVLNQSPLLAQHLLLVERYEDALRLIEAVLPRVPPNALLHHVRGGVLRNLGRLDEAGEAYEAALALRPDLADTHWALATLRTTATPQQRIERIEKARTKRADDSVEHAHLVYAEFHEKDAAGQIDAAWTALQRGAAIMARRLRHDAIAQRERLERLMAMAVTGQEAAAAGALPSQRPIFVVGMPRTGTTLLERMLGNSVGVASLGERNDFSLAVSELAGRFFPASLAEATGLDWALQLDAQRLGIRYLQRIRLLQPIAEWTIDKNPRNLFNLPLIARALPQARIVCLSRNGRDACFSGLKELFQGGGYAYSYRLDDLVEHWRLAQHWMKHWQERLTGQVMVVDYEALVSQPAVTVEKVQAFIGLPIDGAAADISTNVTPSATASNVQVREAVHVRGVGAWTRYASYLQPEFERLGLGE